MKSGLQITRIFGVPIELHASWFLVFGLLTWSLATNLLPQEYPDLSSAWLWALGLVTSLLFFGSVLAHELGHAILALRNSVPVRKITLLIFGGVAQIESEPPTPGVEFRIAIAGPLTSLLLAGFFGLLFLLDQAIPYLAAPSIWLARINLMLAVFNMIPGFPLDGGRVLRAALWQWSGSYLRATRIAASIGQLTAYGFIGFGLFEMFTGRLMDGLWLVFIGSFLNNAASSSATAANIQQALRNVTVGKVMSLDVPRVSGLTSLQRIVEEYMLPGAHPFVLVEEGGTVQGILSLQDIREIPPRKWPLTPAGQAMAPVGRLPQVSPDDELFEVLRFMQQKEAAGVAVVLDGQLLSVLTQNQVQQYLAVRAQLGA